MSAGFAVAIPAREAQAAKYLGCSWGHPGFSYISNMSSDYQAITSASLANWSNQTNISFNAASNPDFSMIDGGYGSTNWDGLTSCSCSDATSNKGTLVRINRTYTNTYSGQTTRSVIAHELGHVVGLADRPQGSTCPSISLMRGDTYTRYQVCGFFAVQSDDIAGANLLY